MNRQPLPSCHSLLFLLACLICLMALPTPARAAEPQWHGAAFEGELRFGHSAAGFRVSLILPQMTEASR